jgi:hypothetical protein
MVNAAVSEDTIIEELRQVLPARWPDVLVFIQSLQPDVSRASEKKTLTAADLLESGLVGMWADRIDMGDSREFARRLREQAQTRSRET